MQLNYAGAEAFAQTPKYRDILTPISPNQYDKIDLKTNNTTDISCLKALLPEILKSIKNYPHGSLYYLKNSIESRGKPDFSNQKNNIDKSTMGMCNDMSQKILELLDSNGIKGYFTILERNEYGKNSRHMAVLVPLSDGRVALIDDDMISEDPDSILVVDKNGEEQSIYDDGKYLIYIKKGRNNVFTYCKEDKSSQNLITKELVLDEGYKYPHFAVEHAFKRPDVSGVLFRTKFIDGEVKGFMAIDWVKDEIVFKLKPSAGKSDENQYIENLKISMSESLGSLFEGKTQKLPITDFLKMSHQEIVSIMLILGIDLSNVRNDYNALIEVLENREQLKLNLNVKNPYAGKLTSTFREKLYA